MQKQTLLLSCPQKFAFRCNCFNTSRNSLSVYFSAISRETQLWFIAISMARAFDTFGIVLFITFSIYRVDNLFVFVLRVQRYKHFFIYANFFHYFFIKKWNFYHLAHTLRVLAHLHLFINHEIRPLASITECTYHIFIARYIPLMHSETLKRLCAPFTVHQYNILCA